MAAIDLDDLRALDRSLRLFSFDRRNLFSLYSRDYSAPLDMTSRDTTPRDTTSTPRDTTSTTLVTNLRFGGYTFNPVSFFLRYSHDDLVGVTAEVNNTYGGRHSYELDASNRISAAQTSSSARVGFRTSRELFVSPFLHGPRTYEWWFPAKRDPHQLAITMHVDTPGGDRIFTATFAGERHALSDRTLVSAAIRYPLNTAQVIGLIHFEAMKLRFLHREPYRTPGPDHRPLDT
jgi:DUF1365 family protein